MSMRPLFTAALISASLSLPTFAQHSGGARGGGFSAHSSGSFGGMHAGGFSRGVAAPRSFASAPHYNWNRAVSSPNFARTNRISSYPAGRPGSGRYNYNRFDHRHDFRFHQPSFFARSTYLVNAPYWAYPGYPPFLDSNWYYDDADTTDANATIAPYADSNANQGSYGPPSNYGPQQGYGQQNEDAYAAPPQTPAGREPYRPESEVEQQPQSVPDQPAITVVFKDGRTPLQIHNYAITSSTLFVLDEHKRDIPLNEIDIAATQKTNQEQGLDFKLPATP
jgi:hypothetical protein